MSKKTNKQITSGIGYDGLRPERRNMVGSHVKQDTPRVTINKPYQLGSTEKQAFNPERPIELSEEYMGRRHGMLQLTNRSDCMLTQQQKDSIATILNSPREKFNMRHMFANEQLKKQIGSITKTGLVMINALDEYEALDAALALIGDIITAKPLEARREFLCVKDLTSGSVHRQNLLKHMNRLLSADADYPTLDIVTGDYANAEIVLVDPLMLTNASRESNTDYLRELREKMVDMNILAVVPTFGERPTFDNNGDGFVSRHAAEVSIKDESNATIQARNNVDVAIDVRFTKTTFEFMTCLRKNRGFTAELDTIEWFQLPLGSDCPNF